MDQNLVELKVGFWNVNGLNNDKLNDNSFIKTVEQYDLLFLIETWHSETSIDSLNFPERYYKFHVFRKKGKCKGRKSGGIIALSRRVIKVSLSVFDNKSENILWLKLALSPEKNIYIAALYNSPGKPSSVNVYSELRDKLLSFSSSDLVFIGGDFNSRTGHLKDFIEESNSEHFVLPDSYETDYNIRQRNNEDVCINNYGHQLVDLCIESKLRILNGRTRGDLQGSYTYIGFKGCSTVDLVLASESVLTNTNMVQYLAIQELSHLSDHKMVLLKLLISTNQINKADDRNITHYYAAERYAIDEPSLIRFSETLDREYIEFNKTHTENQKGNEVDTLLSNIQKTFEKTANNSFHRKKRNIEGKKVVKPKIKNKKWFNRTCQDLRKDLKRTTKLVDSDPKNPFLRGRFFKIRKQYRSCYKKAKRNYEQEALSNLENCKESNRFWELLKSLRNNERQTKADTPNLGKFFDHYYKALLQNLLRLIFRFQIKLIFQNLMD